MNPLEEQLRRCRWAAPDPNWREEILAAAAAPLAEPVRWRDWFWPSPLAWAALFLIWSMLGAWTAHENANAAAPAPAPPQANSPLFALQSSDPTVIRSLP